MTEIYPSDSQLNAMSGQADAEQEVLYVPTGQSPYYTSFYKMLYRLLDMARRAGDLRVYKDGDLTFGVRAGRFMNGPTPVSFAGAAVQALADGAVNCIHLTAAGDLAVSLDEFPDPAQTPHLPLASIVTGELSGEGLSGSYGLDDITDFRGLAFLRPACGLTPVLANQAAAFFGATDITGAEAQTLTGAANADALHKHGAAGLESPLDLTGKVVSVAAPAGAAHPVRKADLDAAILGLAWQQPVLDMLQAPPELDEGDAGKRYLAADNATGDWAGHDDDIAQWDGAAWGFTTPQAGWALWNVQYDIWMTFNGSAWVDIGTNISLDAIVDGATYKRLAGIDAQTHKTTMDSIGDGSIEGDSTPKLGGDLNLNGQGLVDAIAHGVRIGDATTASQIGCAGASIGDGNTVSALNGLALGKLNNVTAAGAIALGLQAWAGRLGELALSYGNFADAGDAKFCVNMLRRITTDDTATELTKDGNAPAGAAEATSNRMVMSSNSALAGIVFFVGVNTATGATAYKQASFSASNVNGTTSIVAYSGINGGTNFSLVADDAADAIAFKATGTAGQTWRWLAAVAGVQVKWS